MANKIRDYTKLAADICAAVGKDNILSATHCATRLRLVLRETPSDEVTKQISEMPAVIKVMESGGQYQVVIGTHAKDVYEALAQLLDLDNSTAAAPEVKQGLGSRIIATMSAVFAPFVYILAAAGLVQGALIIITHFFPAFAATGTYSVLSFISWTPFTFLPVMIAVTASKHFKCNTFIAMWCCMALVNPDWASIAARIADGEVIKFLAFPMSQTTYTSTVLPPLFLVLVLSWLEHWLDEHLPDIIKALAVPFICTIVMVPLTILLIGPVSNVLANAIAAAYNFLANNVPALAAILVGGIWQVFVIFGVHWGVTPMCLAYFANYGCDSFQAFQTCAVIAQAAACFGAFAAGLAAGGYIPVVAIYSSFLQRAYDQILHDVCIQNLPVVFAIDRAGLVGADGETHQGIFDLSFLSSIPNMHIMAPKNKWEFSDMMKYAVAAGCPIAVRYPKGEAYTGLKEFRAPISMGKSEWIYKEGGIALLAVGSMVKTAVTVRDALKEKGLPVSLVNVRFVKPFDKEMVKQAADEHDFVITLEENTANGGFGEGVRAYLEECNYRGKFLSVAIPDCYVEHGSVEQLKKELHMDAESILNRILEQMDGQPK